MPRTFRTPPRGRALRLALALAVFVPTGLGWLPALAHAERSIAEAMPDIFRAEGLLVQRQYEASYEAFRQLHAEFPQWLRVTEGYVRMLRVTQKWPELRDLVESERAARSQAWLFAPDYVAALRGTRQYAPAVREQAAVMLGRTAPPGSEDLLDTLMLESNYSGASLDELRSFAQKAPQAEALQRMLVRALARGGRHEEARELAARLDRGHVPAGQMLQALAQVQAEEAPREAVVTCDRLAREFAGRPEAARARLFKAEVLRKHGSAVEARAELEVLARESSSGSIAIEASLLLAEEDLARDPAAARARAERAAQGHPDVQAAALRLIARSYSAEKKFAEAARTYEAEAAARPPETRLRPMWDRAECFFHAALFDSAEDAYRGAVALDFRDPRANEGLARILLLQGAQDESPEALQAYALASWRAGQEPSMADTALADVEHRFPRTLVGWEAHFQRAELARGSGNVDRALGLYLAFQDTSVQSPRAAEALFLAAELYRVEKKDAAMALKQYSEMVTRFPDAWPAPDARKWVERLKKASGS